MTKKETQVLSWVNRMRAKHFELPPLERLPSGVPGRPRTCPVGIAFQFRCVELTGVRNHPCEQPLFRIPKYVQLWIMRFDQGNYPEYVSYTYPEYVSYAKIPKAT